MAAATERAQVSGVVRAQKGSRAEAMELIFSPLRRTPPEGFRHGALGAPGYGKTHHIRDVIAEAQRRQLVDLVVSHDVKGPEPEFPGTCIAYPTNEEIIAAADHLEQSAHLVCRGNPHQDAECSAEDVAATSKRLARAGLHVLLNMGELDNALTEGGRGWEAPSVRWFSSQGRRLRACLTWTTQQPKRAPDEIFDQSTSISYFHHDARSANYLGNTLMLEPDLVAILPKLARGEHVIWVPGLEWNRRVYLY